MCVCVCVTETNNNATLIITAESLCFCRNVSEMLCDVYSASCIVYNKHQNEEKRSLEKYQMLVIVSAGMSDMSTLSGRSYIPYHREQGQ